MSVEQVSEWGRVIRFPGTDQNEPAQQSTQQPQTAPPEDTAAVDGVDADNDTQQQNDSVAEGDPGTDVAVRPESSGEVALPADSPRNRQLAERARTAARRSGQAARTAGHKTAAGARRAAPHAKRVSAATARHSYWGVTGLGDMTAESWKRLTLKHYDEQAEKARAEGNTDLAVKYLENKRRVQEQRVNRLSKVGALLKNIVEHPVVSLLIAPAAVIGLPLFMAALIAGSQPGGLDAAEVPQAAGQLVAGTASWMWTIGKWAVPAVAVAAVVGFVGTGYNRRRLGGDAPLWAKPADGGDQGRDVLPTEESILGALRNLGIPKMNEAFKNGWGSANSPTKVWEEPVKRDGQGYSSRLRLPQGVTVDAINSKKDVLAHNLTRFPVEVWPTTPKKRPGVMDLWVADSGVLDKPLGPWPWLDSLAERQADFFDGIPVGTDLRGDQVKAPLFQTNYAIAGQMGSGKSSLAMDMVCGAALDPIVDIDVFVMAENTDFDPLAKRLSTLRTGPGDDVIADAAAHLKALYDDLGPRGKALKENATPGKQPPRKTSRALAEADDRLRPRIVVIDECQNLFGSKEHGEEAAQALHLLVSTARKYGIVVILLTPEPSSESLPRRTMSIISRKACFSIGDQTSNDAILGTGSYKRGVEAMSLEPANDEDNGDVGTAMTRGFRKRPSLVRFYYISEDEMGRVSERAVELVNDSGGVRTAEVTRETRNLLEDLDQVLGEEPMKAKDAASALRTLAPTWKPYEKLTGTSLRKQLWDGYGIRCTNPQNVSHVPPEEVRRTLAQQAAATPEDNKETDQNDDEEDEGDDAVEVDEDFLDED